MAAVTITAASIIKGTTAPVRTERGIAGATLTAGLAVYLDTTDSNKVKACDSNSSLAAAAAVGITLHAALSGQPIEYITSGPLAMGACLTQGLIYVAGASTAGDINPAADLSSGWYTTILGIATSTSILNVDIKQGGIAV